MDHTRCRQTPQVKLKDSCDVCSAHKVRCTKEKPRCTRCDKYGYPCVYSPARRIGRPYKAANYQQLPEQQASLAPDQQQHQQQRAASLDTLPLGHNHHGTTTAIYSATANAPDGVGTEFKAQQKQLGSIHKSSHHHHNDQQEQCVLVKPGGSIDAADQSCVDRVLNTLSAATTHPTLQDLFSYATTLDAGIRELERVLVCPCAEQLSVALLVATYCHNLLSMFDCAGSSSFSSTAATSTSTATHSPNTNSTGSCEAGNGDGLSEVQHVAHAATAAAAAAGSGKTLPIDLHRIASLVMQFTRRYRGTSSNGKLNETLLSVAEGLKGRLHTLI